MQDSKELALQKQLDQLPWQSKKHTKELLEPEESNSKTIVEQDQHLSTTNPTTNPNF